MKKKILLFAIFLFPFLIPSTSMAATIEEESITGANIMGNDIAFINASGLDGSATVGDIASNIISLALSLLGIGFIVLIIAGGFKWMTAQGNEEEAKKAMKIIQMAIIGLIIIISAYSITHFVFSALNESVSQSGSLNP